MRKLIGNEYFQEVVVVSLDGPATDATLAAVGDLDDLRHLSIFDSSKIRSGLVHLRGMRNLEVLQLNGPGITDASLVNLRSLSALRNLYMKNTGVSDEGLANLAGLTELQSLRLKGKEGTAAGQASRGIVRVTDAGLVRSLDSAASAT